MAEKTEKATPKKLRDARKKGQVAKAQDLPSAITFIVSIAVTMGMVHYLYDLLSQFTTGAFQAVANPNLDGVITNLFSQGIMLIFLCSMPVLVVVSVMGVLTTFLTVGPVFSVEVFKPDIKKFNMVENIKQKFKMKTLFELVKSLLKIGIASYLIYGVMYNSFPVLVQTVSIPVAGSLLVFNQFLMEVLIKVGLLFIVIAVADFVFQKHDFAKEMKMEKFEVKQEYKNTEGDPQIKSRRRQIAQEIAYQEGPAGAVKRAQAVVTNPTHLAIAIGYKKDLDAAPFILTMGENELAERIVKLAETYNVPIMRNIPLAHQLWEDGEIYEYIPEDTFEAVAEILKWVASLQEELE